MGLLCLLLPAHCRWGRIVTTETALVKRQISAPNFTEGQIQALRVVLADYLEMIQDLQDEVEELKGLQEVR